MLPSHLPAMQGSQIPLIAVKILRLTSSHDCDSTGFSPACIPHAGGLMFIVLDHYAPTFHEAGGFPKWFWNSLPWKQKVQKAVFIL